MSPEGGPSFRDLYDVQRDTDDKLDKVETRIGRIEKALVVLIVIVASPKAGGPSASSLVAGLIQQFS